MSGPSTLSPMPGAAPRAQPLPRLPWPWRLRDAVTTYLPLLLMVLLVLSTWWLVKNTPMARAPSEAAVPRHEPDYTMRDFTLQRFGVDGRLRVQIEGEMLRHYPDTDDLEIDNVRIRAVAPDGAVTRATARRAIANGEGTEVRLLGGAQVTREAVGDQGAVEFEGEFLHAFLETEQLRSHLPVLLRQGGSEVHAGGIDYQHGARAAELQGPIRAMLPPQRSSR
jgi:lipopolysaccharide export system protein LptC